MFRIKFIIIAGVKNKRVAYARQRKENDAFLLRFELEVGKWFVWLKMAKLFFPTKNYY